MTVDIVVVGAGGFGREVLDVVEAANAAKAGFECSVVGVIDDGPTELNLDRLHARGYRFLGGVADWAAFHSPIGFIVGIGNPAVREHIDRQMLSFGHSPATIVHPSSSVGSLVEIGEGTVVCGGVHVSTNVRIGRHVHLNAGSTVGHDAVLGDFTSVNPGGIISGEVAVNRGTLIGAGAVVLQRLTVGEECVVGASACVVRDVPDGVVVKGVPAR